MTEKSRWVQGVREAAQHVSTYPPCPSTSSHVNHQPIPAPTTTTCPPYPTLASALPVSPSTAISPSTPFPPYVNVQPKLHFSFLLLCFLWLNILRLCLPLVSVRGRWIQVWALAFLPHTVKVILLGDRFNNLKPRDPIQYKATDSTSFKETM